MNMEITLYCKSIRKVMEINNISKLTYQEEIELSKLIEAGDEDAKNKMILANLPLVVHMAKKDLQWAWRSGVDLSLEDVVSEGNIGLMKAVEKFDYRKGFKFSTYASYWIRQSIQAAIFRTGLRIRVPVYIYKILLDADKLIKKYYFEKNVEIDIYEALDIMGMNEKRKRMVISAFNSRSFHKHENSIDEIIDRKDCTIGDKENEFNINDVNMYIEELNDRQVHVIKRRFGIMGSKKMTLRDIGKELGITRERVRQIEMRAIAIMDAKRKNLENTKFA